MNWSRNASSLVSEEDFANNFIVNRISQSLAILRSMKFVTPHVGYRIVCDGKISLRNFVSLLCHRSSSD